MTTFSDTSLRHASATMQRAADLIRQSQPVVWRVCVALGSADSTEDVVQKPTRAA